MQSGPPPAETPGNNPAADSSAELRPSDIAPYWLAAIIESADDAIITKTLEGVITSWNKAAERIFGYTAVEAVGRPVSILIPDDQPDEEPSILARLKRGEHIEHYETVRVRKDGSRVDISLTVSPIKGADGRIVGASKIARDISERKRAAAELQATEHRFARFMENLPGLAWIKDTRGRYVYANEAASRAFGVERGELYGRTDEEVFPAATAAQFRENDLRALASGAGVQTVEVLEQQDGPHYSIVSKFPILDPAGEPLMVGGVAFDVTEQKRAEEALRSSEARLRALFAAMTDIVLVLGGDGRYLEVAPTNPRLLYKPPAELIGRTLHDVLPPPTADFFLAHVRRALVARQTHAAEYELSIGGEVVWFEASISPMTEDAVFWIARDVTARKLAEQERERLHASEQKARAEAEEASRLKDEFLATLSHELRTPLTAIVGWSTLLRTNSFDEQATAKALETVERNARAQMRLVEDLMDVSRIITGKLRLEVRPVDLVPVIEAAVEAVRPASDAKEIGLRVALDAPPAHVSCDPVRLQQVVWNLLSNAVKFTPRGGRVEVRLRSANAHVEISVSDDGAGIAPEFLPHVFDRFRQADQRITRQHGGLGLGLSIVRHLVELHGGAVRAESEGEGRGATFRVLLPVAATYEGTNVVARGRAAASVALPAYECSERLDGLRVLVVDDEPDTQELLKIGLGRCGALVLVAGSAGEALEALAASRPDLLISDIGMAGEDGYELIRRVRALPADAGGRVPAVALTAYARAEDRMQALRAGYQMHVAKPVELAELVAVVASLTRRDG